MKIRKRILCLLVTVTMLSAVGCSKTQTSSQSNVNFYDENNPAPTQAAAQEVEAELGQSASVGGMTVNVTAMEDPDIIMDKTGKMALFFAVAIDNNTDETVQASYLNNFSLTVDGTEYDSDVCCTIPVMKKLYDFHGVSAMNEEIAPGATVRGYVACEANPDFKNISLHYTPKTADKESRVTVNMTKDDMTKAKK